MWEHKIELKKHRQKPTLGAASFLLSNRVNFAINEQCLTVVINRFDFNFGNFGLLIWFSSWSLLFVNQNIEMYKKDWWIFSPLILWFHDSSYLTTAVRKKTHLYHLRIVYVVCTISYMSQNGHWFSTEFLSKKFIFSKPIFQNIISLYRIYLWALNVIRCIRPKISF